MEPASFWNVEEKWIPEIRAWSPGTPCLLIGTQIDLRDNAMSLQKMSHKKQKPISKDEGERMAKKCGAYAYIECSSLLNLNVKHGNISFKAFSAMQPIYDHYKKI
jgi:cell division control protein 42